MNVRDLTDQTMDLYAETGLSPRQLAEQRDELLRALRKARRLIYSGVTGLQVDKEDALNSINAAIANTRRTP